MRGSKSEGSANVVVIGGGMTGSYAAYLLQKYCKVTLIDEKEYFQIIWASLRALVKPKFENSIMIKHKDYLKSSKRDPLVIGKASGITTTHVHTPGGFQYDYDYAILATGMSSASYPFLQCAKAMDLQAEIIADNRKKIVAAEAIVIVGGGPVGVELAGEIITEFPDKKISLVHSGKRLLEFMPCPEGGEGAQKWLESKNVHVILEDRLHITPEMENSNLYVTDGGKEIRADLSFLCVGGRPNTDFLKNGDDWKDALDEKGFVKVDEYFRVHGKTNVFALGDVANVDEPKLGYLGLLHAEHVANTIKALIKSGENVALEGVQVGYKPKPKSETPIFVSLGRDYGLGMLHNGNYVEGSLPTFIKSKALCVDKIKGALGLYGPSFISPFIGFTIMISKGILG